MQNEPLSVAQTAALLQQADHILILTHQYPDGDTLGSAFALCHALQRLHKHVRVLCNDPVPERYDYLSEGLPSDDTDETTSPFICAVDVASAPLLGKCLQPYADHIDLSIDHHGSHSLSSRYLLLDADSAATAMLIQKVIVALGVPIDPLIAQAIYTGIATDTGCFRYANVSSEALRMAADMLDVRIPFAQINRVMFDIKSRARLDLERRALSGILFFCEGRCAVMPITLEMIAQSGADESDMEGLAPIPRQIENVWVGVTMREKPDGTYKVSVRTGTHANAAAICTRLGGGGHAGAAGCTVNGPLDDAVHTVVAAVSAAIGR